MTLNEETCFIESTSILNGEVSMSEAILISEAASKDSFNEEASMRHPPQVSIRSHMKQPQCGNLNSVTAMTAPQLGSQKRQPQQKSLNKAASIWQPK